MTSGWSNWVQPQASHWDVSLDTDVLVIGGSLAGAWAALKAREQGARVVIVDKGFIGTAGAAAPANVGGYYADPSNPEQTRKAVLSRHDSACGMDDLAWIERVYTDSFKAYTDLERLGFQYQSRPNGLAQKGRFIGGYTLHFLRKALKRAGVKILDHSPALELLRDEQGQVCGASGVTRQPVGRWIVTAGAVVAATGGGSFLSGAMGTRGLTFDGHLMAMEAGASIVNMEFSTLYGYAPLRSPCTKGFLYAYASFYDGQRRALQHGPAREAMEIVARSILETGGAYAILDKAPEGFEAWARLNHAVSFLYFDRLGINPFKQLWPIHMLLEGHTRGVGGVAVDRQGSTGVAGLYAAGDLTDRLPLTGANMSGGGPAVAWCFASGQWAGQSAAQFALEHSTHTGALQALGSTGLRAQRDAKPDCAAPASALVREQMLPLNKHFFRDADSLTATQQTLDQAWQHSQQHLAPTDTSQALACRESAALQACARWTVASALARKESRGLHRRQDFAEQDPAQSDYVYVHQGMSSVQPVRQHRLAPELQPSLEPVC